MNIETIPSEGLWSKIKSMLAEIRKTYRAGGFKAVWSRYGWKLFAAFFVYYLVRDVTLYIIIPYLVAKHILS